MKTQHGAAKELLALIIAFLVFVLSFVSLMTLIIHATGDMP